MDIPDSVLRGLAGTGVFVPSRINDGLRVDLVGEDPFLAVDKDSAREVDDAIRVRALRGKGPARFLLDLAVVDGAQLSDRLDLVRHAVAHGPSWYGYRTDNLMLPESVVRQLELRTNNTKHRATVIRRLYDRDGTPVSEPQVTPAFIRSVRITPNRLARLVRSDPDLRPLWDFAATQRTRDLPIQPEVEVPLGRVANREGHLITSVCIVLGNVSVTGWMQERDLPLIRRVFDGQNRAYFTTDMGYHDGLPTRRREIYGQFTSPLRRPGDLLMHLQVGNFWAHGQALLDQATLSAHVKNLKAI